TAVEEQKSGKQGAANGMRRGRWHSTASKEGGEGAPTEAIATSRPSRTSGACAHAVRPEVAAEDLRRGPTGY
ncbi:hypothetical protein C8Q77DRAFT_1141279, partial [Trametes polyzona]